MTSQRAGAIVVLTALLFSLVPLPTTNAEPARVDSSVWRVLEAEGQADILVILTEQADLSGARALATKEEKGWYVYRQLTATAERAQPPLLAYLDRRGVPYQSYWIRNMIRVQADAALVRALARRPEVARIDYHYPVDLEPILPSEPASDQPSAVGWNIQRVRADDVWDMGFTGSGVLVGMVDSGVDWDHPGLINAYRPWVPGAPTRHDYNWYDGPSGSQVPVDYTGHGTAMTGLVVGDDGGDNQTGMAPGAQWIACSMMGNQGMDCLQFMLAPTRLDGSNPRPDLAPHVLSNSWRARVDYSDIIHTLYLAGIMFIKAAENDGFDCGTVASPGHLPEVTAVGAFEEGDTITWFSSRGPMLYNGQTIIKPNLAAPGLDCPTTTNGGGYGNSMGTSAACPHVTGVVALILSARPDLAGRVDTLQMILQETAEPKVDLQCPPNDPSGVPNNVWGYGILNAYDAVLLAQSLGMGDIQGQVSDNGTGQPIAAAEISFEDSAGRSLLGTDVTGGVYTHTLPASTYTVTVATYGYHPGVVSGVPVISGGLTIQDISLTARPAYVISGTVCAAGSGDPLSATVTVLYAPLSPVQSDPTTGFYSLTLAEGSHTLRVESFQRLSEDRPVLADGDQTQDLTLDPVPYIPYAGNPVLEPGPGDAWDSQVVSAPSVVFVDGTYYLFYLGSGPGNIGAVGYATSSDGVNFEKYVGNPILAGDGSGFDADYVGFPAVLVEEGTWIIYYLGQASGGQMRIGRATAPAPSGPWTRNYNPVLAPGSFWEWDGGWIFPNSVIQTDEGYVLYYTGGGIAPVRSKIGRATSPNGIVWTKYDDPGTPGSPYAESDPVLWPGLPDAWDYRYAFRSSVRQTAGGWEMFYGGYGSLFLSSAIGYASSPDGIHWTKDTRNPILQPKDEPLAAAYLQNPSSVQAGSTDWLYYDDMEYFDDTDNHIGVATRTTSPPAIAVEPLSLEVPLYVGEQLTQTLWISNTGRVDLTFALHEMSRTLGYDVPWLSEDPVSGTLVPGEGMSIDVTFDATGLVPSIYQGQLDVESNDPLTPTVCIPVTLAVIPNRIYLPIVVREA
jgi:subtilisin family serine protease